MTKPKRTSGASSPSSRPLRPDLKTMAGMPPSTWPTGPGAPRSTTEPTRSGWLTRAAPLPDQQSYWNRWHARTTEADAEAEHKQFVEEFVEFMCGRGPRVLEFACGKGYDAAFYAKSGLSVEAFDFSQIAISEARNRHGESDVLHFEVLDHSKPLWHSDSSVDGVVSYLGLHYFDDATTRAVFQEIARVLKPYGGLQLLVKSTNDLMYGDGVELGPDVFLRGEHLRHFFSRQYLLDLAATAGFEACRITEYDGWYLGHTRPSSFVFAQLSKTR